MNEKKLIEKNIMDLKHSMYVTKGGTLLGLAIGSWFMIFETMKNTNSQRAFIVATLITACFFYTALDNFNKCYDIQNQISQLSEQ